MRPPRKRPALPVCDKVRSPRDRGAMPRWAARAHISTITAHPDTTRLRTLFACHKLLPNSAWLRMFSVPFAIWAWTCGAIGFFGVLFCAFILFSRKRHLPDKTRRIIVVAIWVAVCTGAIWLLFIKADKDAAAIHQQNVGMAVVYIYFWSLAVVPSPLVGFALSRLFRKTPR